MLKNMSLCGPTPGSAIHAMRQNPVSLQTAYVVMLVIAERSVQRLTGLIGMSAISSVLETVVC